MFSDYDSEAIGFESLVDTEKCFDDNISQTTPLKYLSEESQTVESHSKSTQIIQQELTNQHNATSYDSNRLLSFLQRIMPHLEEELENYENSKSSSEFKTKSTKTYENSQSSGTEISIKPEVFKGKVISDFSWNSTNSLFAITGSEKTHESWCNHETSIVLYRNKKEEFEKQNVLQTLKCSSCVRCIQFHPFIPSLLAGGFHNGEVVIWDLSNGETLLTRNKEKNEDAHDDAITSLVWKENNDNVMLVSTGRDGKIIFWKVTATNLSYEISEKLLILKQSNTSISSALNEHHEISQIGFWAHKENDFVVAAGENLLHCSLSTTKNLLSYPKYKDPVSMTYKQHGGIVTSVSCSSTSDLFLSCGIDGRIQINSFKVNAPLLAIETNYPVLGIIWITDVCFVSWGTTSKVELFNANLDSCTYSTRIIFEVQENISKIAINLPRQKRMAVGNTQGEIFLLNDLEL